MITIHLPYPTPSQNSLSGYSWRRRTIWRKKFESELLGECLRQRLKRPVTTKRKVTITRHSAGTLDKGNLIGGCKPLLDALVRLGLLVDDSPEWLDDHYRQVKCPRKAARTEICIEEMETT
jgi:hypothetical protein